jgi:predicted glutamine amidotransferase
MCRLLAWAGREAVTVADALGERDFEAFTALSRQHADGWGMAWWPGHRDDGGPQVATSTLCAADDARYRAVTHGAAGDLGFVHLRWATPGLPVVDANTHPFAQGSWAFAHNGAIHPQDRLDEILPPGWKARMRGTTDSERYFLAIAARLEDGASVRDAVAVVVEDIFTRLEPTSLNAMLLGPDALHIIAAHDPARVPAVGASSSGGSGSSELDTVFYDLHHRRRADSFVVASSGFRQAGDDDWQPVPNMSLLTIERHTLATSMETLMPSGSQLVS